MRILFIGNGNHQLLIGYLQNLKKNNNELIFDIITTQPIDSTNVNLYNNIIYIKTQILPNTLPGFNLLSIIFVFFSKLIISRKYEYIHIHFVNYYYYYFTWLLKLKCNKLIITFWGSDFENAINHHYNKIKYLINNVNIITCTSLALHNKLSDLKINDRVILKICKFGLLPIDEIDKLKSKTDSKKKLDLPLNKIIVTVGYNYSENQQHFEIIKNLECDSELIKNLDDYLFVFPLTYGNDLKYFNSLISKIANCKLHTKIFDSYLTDYEIAHLRNSTDIFIQLQKHDQFSGSMSEHLYANNIVITGSWLNYNELKNNSIKFIEIHSLSDLRNFTSVVKNFTIQNVELNNKKIESLTRWSYLIDDWIKLYR